MSPFFRLFLILLAASIIAFLWVCFAAALVDTARARGIADARTVDAWHCHDFQDCGQ